MTPESFLTKRLLLALVGAAAVAGVGWTAAKNPGVGPQHVWRLSEGAIADLHKCTRPTRRDCVHKVMQRHGASTEAFEFYRRTGWFLSELKDTGGPVMLASLVDPWRANENEQPALVGEKIVYPEKVKVVLDNDDGFKALKAAFPRLLFWKSGPTFEANTITADGEKVIFRYRLLDGCHACATRGWARIEFEFGPDGTYRRANLLGVVRE